MTKRDNFSLKIKTELAGRVGWRCAFPGCRVATIGPKLEGSGVVITGEAAHITAASPGGPRYDDTMTSEARKDAQNGLWLCANHADIVDKDELNYSVATLKIFRRQAEELAHHELTQFRRADVPSAELLTLVEVGFDLVFEGYWASAERDVWRFQIHRWLMGTMAGLTQYITRFDQLPETDRFLAVESQGDGRALLRAPGWQRGGGSDQALGVVEFSIRPLPMRRDPRDLGTDLAMGDGDLVMENGDLKVVSGEANARQKLRLLVNTPVGGLFFAEEYGVRWRPLALLFGEDLTLLGRLFRLDLARVISAPVRIEELNLSSGTIKSVLKPQIDVVERVEEVVVHHLNLDRSEAIVEIAVIWANGLPWRGQVNVFLSDKPERPVAPSRTPPGPY